MVRRLEGVWIDGADSARNTLRAAEKKSYIGAVQCLQAKPGKRTEIPGVKTRYDDFVATHIQQTRSIHNTGNFLSWHRFFTWAYEQALRNECSYNGTFPYLNWGKLVSNPVAAPVFDGSDTSISGNGAYRQYGPINFTTAANPFFQLPQAQGGDCLLSGPFKDFKINLGPVASQLSYVPRNPQANGLGYNPRCIRRDINPAAAASLYDTNTTDLIINSEDVLTFQNTLQGNFPAGLIGIHTAGHFLVGADPGGDFYVSPGDPYFFLHHAQIDRVWWIWQNQDLPMREKELVGTITMNNSPPSRNATLEDLIELPTIAETFTVGDLLSTTKGPFCYTYV